MVICGAELDTETEYSTNAINSIRTRNDYLQEIIASLLSMKTSELRHIDYWLYSKLNSKIKSATAYMDRLEFRAAMTELYFNTITELKQYIERGAPNQIVVRELLEPIILMIAPSMPHIAEEFWHALGRDTFVSTERWPEHNESMINQQAEKAEQIIMDTCADLSNAIELTSKIGTNKSKKLNKIEIILADEWKAKAYALLAASKDMKSVMANEELNQIDKEKLSKFLAQFTKTINALKHAQAVDNSYMLTAFSEAKQYLEQRFNAEVIIEQESKSHSQRAQRALPEKPCIDLSWA